MLCLMLYIKEGISFVFWPQNRTDAWLYGHVVGNFGPQHSIYNFTGIPWIADDTTDLCDENAVYSDMKDKVVLVLRGNCSFTQKVANAEKNKALAVLIGNTSDEYVHKNHQDEPQLLIN